MKKREKMKNCQYPLRGNYGCHWCRAERHDENCKRVLPPLVV